MADTTKRLIGKDGKIYTCTKGTEITGNGSTTLGDGYYVATHIATSGSGLPTGLQTKYVFKGNSSIIPAATEKVIPLLCADTTLELINTGDTPRRSVITSLNSCFIFTFSRRNLIFGLIT